MAALTRLRAVTRLPASSTSETAALQMAAYVEGLSRYSVGAIEQACREWPDQDGGAWWPSLAELARLVSKHDTPANALPRPTTEDDGRTRPRDERTLRNSASLRAEYVELMAALKANPEKFVGAAALIAIGEDLMAKAGMVDASARAA